MTNTQANLVVAEFERCGVRARVSMGRLDDLGEAQTLMERHNISEALLAKPGEVSEPISNQHAPLTDGSYIPVWRWRLASVLSAANACSTYHQPYRVDGPAQWRIKVVGRPSDVATVRYLFDYCSREIDRLAKAYAGNGTTWLNNYRHGAVDAIYTKLDSERRVLRSNMVRDAIDPSAMERAIVRVDEKKLEVDRWVKANLRLRMGGGSSYRGDADARATGRRDGATINMGGGAGLGRGSAGQIGSGR